MPASAFQPKEIQVQHQPQVPLTQISQQPQTLAYWMVEQQGYQHQQLGVASQPMTPQHPLSMNIQSSEVDWTSKIVEVMQDHFGLKPKQPIYMYRTPYSAAYDNLSFPHRYKVPDFTKFSGQGDTSTIEHVNRFVIQCGEAAAHNHSSAIFIFFVRRCIHLVHLFTSQLCHYLGRFGKTFPSVFLFWKSRDEIDRLD